MKMARASTQDLEIANQIAGALDQLIDGYVPECASTSEDDFECLDVDTWKAFCDVAPKTGLQLIVTRVTEGPLKITRINSEEVAA